MTIRVHGEGEVFLTKGKAWQSSKGRRTRKEAYVSSTFSVRVRILKDGIEVRRGTVHGRTFRVCLIDSIKIQEGVHIVRNAFVNGNSVMRVWIPVVKSRVRVSICRPDKIHFHVGVIRVRGTCITIWPRRVRVVNVSFNRRIQIVRDGVVGEIKEGVRKEDEEGKVRDIRNVSVVSNVWTANSGISLT